MCLLRMMRRRLFTRQRAQIGGHGDISFVVNVPQHHRAFWHIPLMRDKARKKGPAHASRPPPTERLLIESVSAIITAGLFSGHGYRESRFRGFELAPWALRKEAARWNRQWGESDRRSTQEGARRGKATVLRGSAEVRTRWSSGTERCPLDVATDGGSKGGGLGVEK